MLLALNISVFVKPHSSASFFSSPLSGNVYAAFTDACRCTDSLERVPSDASLTKFQFLLSIFPLPIISLDRLSYSLLPEK